MGEAGIRETLLSESHGLDFDVVIIGGGLSGIYSLISMRQLGLSARVFERGADVGGVWYWNRYPGARFDSESYTYGFSFSQEVLDGWDWTEHYSAQPETLRYINFVVDKMGVRSDFQFNTEITSAHYQEESRSWLLKDVKGRQYTSRFLINALGPLTTPQLPNIPGIHDFNGDAYHTSRWPHHPICFKGKRVGIIGTGATGIQTIQEVAKEAEELVVFQRTPNWTAPMRNSQISCEEMQRIRDDYPNIFQRCKSSPMGFQYTPDLRKTLELPKEEREAFWEDLYARRGLVKWLGNFQDIFTSEEANNLFSTWMAEKIQNRVIDPAIAKKLIPTNHGFGTRRVPLENNYYEIYNQPNVKLVDLRSEAIKNIQPTGVATVQAQYDLDVLIYATGFDALTGSYEQIEYRGLSGILLSSKWENGPRTYLGMTVEGFPNMFNVLGPHQASGNIPRSIEYAVQWVTRCIAYCRDNMFTFVMPTKKGEDLWTEHVLQCTQGLLSTKVNSWMTGYNSNKPTKTERTVIRYSGSLVEFRRRCDEVANKGYTHIGFSS
ncbi:FAD/NAD(P)-binding domain-containing protein [Aspergillus bertholletiae]|uniref:FAD/NAD(P)-binding domain-containing protein n=1 Tax=Aspergillus bertholletiae TaxID=1226010 RepID=A0A5N7BL07_9EURO|nr:FAD/NAD(P)-binding domain-containing protein [Aspergillus bertholletiae]